VARDNGLWLILIFLFLSVYLLPTTPTGSTNWASAASIVENGSFDISWAASLIGTSDNTIVVGEKIYSTEAPGIAAASAPVYALTRLVVGPPNEANLRTSLFVMRLFLSTLPLLLLAVWLYARESDDLSLATLLFATPLFVYSLVLSPYVLAAIVVYFAFRVIYDQRYVMPWHAFLAGIISGIAVSMEYSAAVPVAVFGLGLLFADKRERLRRAVFFIVGLVPFLVLFAWYDYSLFGTVLPPAMPHIGWPSLWNYYYLLLSPSRGLIFFAPIFLLAFAALFSSREIGTTRQNMKVAAIIISIIVLCGFGEVREAAFGPARLIVVMPLLLDSFFDGDTYEMSNMWQGLWFGLSIVSCVLPVLSAMPLAPAEVALPHRNFWLQNLIEEKTFAPTLANTFGAPAAWWTLIPVAAFVLLAVYLVMRNMRRPHRFGIGLIAAAVVSAIYLFV
jgi:hypothetical protein